MMFIFLLVFHTGQDIPSTALLGPVGKLLLQRGSLWGQGCGFNQSDLVAVVLEGQFSAASLRCFSLFFHLVIFKKAVAYHISSTGINLKINNPRNYST
jgi:hypothetical protein